MAEAASAAAASAAASDAAPPASPRNAASFPRSSSAKVSAFSTSASSTSASHDRPLTFPPAMAEYASPVRQQQDKYIYTPLSDVPAAAGQKVNVFGVVVLADNIRHSQGTEHGDPQRQHGSVGLHPPTHTPTPPFARSSPILRCRTASAVQHESYLPLPFTPLASLLSSRERSVEPLEMPEFQEDRHGLMASHGGGGIRLYGHQLLFLTAFP
ncbi:unnamed protein product [Closterium sp. Yama58-4]|nr:unnamed protein product [Closterium sp. Yama58-4]